MCRFQILIKNKKQQVTIKSNREVMFNDIIPIFYAVSILAKLFFFFLRNDSMISLQCYCPHKYFIYLLDMKGFLGSSCHKENFWTCIMWICITFKSSARHCKWIFFHIYSSKIASFNVTWNWYVFTWHATNPLRDKITKKKNRYITKFWERKKTSLSTYYQFF